MVWNFAVINQTGMHPCLHFISFFDTKHNMLRVPLSEDNGTMFCFCCNTPRDKEEKEKDLKTRAAAYPPVIAWHPQSHYRISYAGLYVTVRSLHCPVSTAGIHRKPPKPLPSHHSPQRVGRTHRKFAREGSRGRGNCDMVIDLTGLWCAVGIGWTWRQAVAAESRHREPSVGSAGGGCGRRRCKQKSVAAIGMQPPHFATCSAAART
jgi:hypothetical protein